MEIDHSSFGVKIAVLLTCYNRREKTLSCLRGLFLQDLPFHASLTVFLMDDGSTDGTSEVVSQEFPQVRILHGDGSLFWCGGMRRAWKEALAEGYDHYLWLNDDTILLSGALMTLLNTSEQMINKNNKTCIVVGSCRDPETKLHSYGGRMKRNRRVRLPDKPLAPRDTPIQTDTMNGNIVLIPQKVVDEIGILSYEFTHAFGDVDYGLRANEAGIPVIVAPGYLGECSRNSKIAPWTDPTVSLRERLKNLQSPKGLPTKQWCIYVRRHTGWQWPFYALKPIIRVLFPHFWSIKADK